MGILGFGKRKKIGIAFGGGGTRGIAHIGAIRVFQENNIEFDYVSGNSAGSVAGALFACGVPWQEIYDFILKDRIRQSMPRRWLSYWSADVIEDMVDTYLEGKDFNDLDKPFCTIAVDIEHGTLDRLCSGSVSRAVSASCAVPGMFQPVKIDGKLYVDGGILRSIPTQTVRDMGADTVVGINLNSDRGMGTESLRRRDVLFTAYQLSFNVNAEICAKYADLMLEPDLSGYARHSTKNAQEMLEIGERTVKAQLEEIKKLMK